MDLGLKGYLAVVTAASRGLGRAAARALALEGADVAICSRSDQIFDAQQAIEAEAGVQVLASQTDVSDENQVNAFIKQAFDRFGRIDILILNAGGPPPGGFLDLTSDDWRKAVDLTLMSAVYLCRAVVPIMIDQGEGSIVATESYSVKQPIPNLILSNALRMAVIGMLKTMANELGPKGIRVNSINPAWTWTERVEQLMTDRAERAGSSIEEQSAAVAASIPLGRMGTVEEYGRTIAWLASPAASFIHGHALMFDGGATQASL